MSVKTKIFGLASSAVLFVGIAYGQPALNCGTTGIGPGGVPNPGAAGINPSNPITLRAEGTTELVSDTITPCSAAPVGLAGAAGNVLVSMTGVAGITSKDSYVLIVDPTGVKAPVVYGPGVVSGLTISFGTAAAPVFYPAYNFNLQVTNLRVNVTQAYPTNIPLPVTETVFAGALGISSLFPALPQVVGNIRNGLTVGPLGAATNFPICVGVTNTQAFSVTVGEVFAGAFKVASVTPAGLGGALLPVSPQTLPNFVGDNPNVPGSESGSLVGGVLMTGPGGPTNVPGISGTVGVPTSGTRIKFVFAGIPANATLSVPATVTSASGNLNLTLTSSETGTFSAAGVAGSIVPLTANGSGVATAIYEVTVANLAAIKSATLNAYVTFLANVPTAPSGPITVTTSYSPSPATPGTAPTLPPATTPYFLNNGTPLNGSVFSVCQTTLLFPFVTNEVSFETGIAIANAGADNLGATATSPYGGKSVASGQSGACTIYFYGSTAGEGGAAPATPTAANFPASTLKPAMIAPGTTHADTLSDILATSTPAMTQFQGYAIAVCPFLYARGFAFIEYGIATNAGIVEGYLADVINSNRTSTVGVNATVLNNTPETSGH